jgi:hypothetical protein
MNILKLFAISLVMTSTSVIAEDVTKNELSNEEMAHVVSGIITLKIHCNKPDEDTCKQADAIMKLFKSHTLTYGKTDDNLKNNAALAMEILMNGYIAASVEASK